MDSDRGGLKNIVISQTKKRPFDCTHSLPALALHICRLIHVHVVFVLPLEFALPLPLPLPLALSLKLGLAGSCETRTQTGVNWPVRVTRLLLLVDNLLERCLILLLVDLLVDLGGRRAVRDLRQLVVKGGKDGGSG